LPKRTASIVNRLFEVARESQCTHWRASGRARKKLNARPSRRFLFALAGHLGMTVRELCTRMDSRELSEWYAYVHHFSWASRQPLAASRNHCIRSASTAPVSRQTLQAFRLCAGRQRTAARNAAAGHDGPNHQAARRLG